MFRPQAPYKLFEKDEVLSGQNTPYTVFTPYSRKWKEKLAQNPIQVYPSESLSNYVSVASQIPTLESIGFQKAKIFPRVVFWIRATLDVSPNVERYVFRVQFLNNE